jgi:suppressor for copper-sensitivity B
MIRLPRAALLLPLLAVLAATLAAAAAAQPLGRVEKAELSAAADRESYAPGDPVRVVAVMRIDEGWHVNSHWPTFDYLIPTELRLTLPEGWETPEIEYPQGEMDSFAFADQPLSVYDGEVKIFATTRVPESSAASRAEIGVELRYQACDDRSCLPPVDSRAEVVVALGETGAATSEELFRKPAEGRGPERPAAPLGLAWMLLLGVLGGLILNAMPCVLPVLSLKVMGLVKAAGQGGSQVVAGSLATAAGILISFWGLALAAVLARTAGAAVGWGVQFQNPVFVTVLAVVVILFCLNLWGLFEIGLPASISIAVSKGPHQGLSGHFASGLFATLMATPCSAPFLGTAVGFALSQSAPTVFVIFTAVGFGMALPYFALALFPRSATLLPKPGAWMEKLRGVMGFLLAGAAIWLFYVLMAQIPAERLAFVQLAILVLCLFVWLRSRATPGSWPSRILLAGAAASIVVALLLAAGGPSAAAVRAAVEENVQHIDWVPFDREEAERLTEEGRLVFVDVTADWCFTCKVNERMVLETEEIAGAFERHGVVPMQADWTNRDDTIAAFLADHGRYGVPFYLLYRPGRAPWVFSELLTREQVLEALEEARSPLAEVSG